MQTQDASLGALQRNLPASPSMPMTGPARRSLQPPPTPEAQAGMADYTMPSRPSILMDESDPSQRPLMLLLSQLMQRRSL